MNWILRKPTGGRYYIVSIVYFFQKWGRVIPPPKKMIF
jgi:hypothetical protein